jgi:hypothetical protein
VPDDDGTRTNSRPHAIHHGSRRDETRRHARNLGWVPDGCRYGQCARFGSSDIRHHTTIQYFIKNCHPLRSSSALTEICRMTCRPLSVLYCTMQYCNLPRPASLQYCETLRENHRDYLVRIITLRGSWIADPHLLGGNKPALMFLTAALRSMTCSISLRVQLGNMHRFWGRICRSRSVCSKHIEACYCTWH